MKRLLLAMLAVALPAAAQAQVPGVPATPEGVLLPFPAPAASASMVMMSTSSTEDGRPSMAALVEGSTISSKFLVRFESAKGLKALDRAEYFTAKCGCYRFAPVNGPFYDANAKGPGPGQATDVNYTQLVARAEFAMNSRFSVVGELPLRTFAPQTFLNNAGTYGSATGVSDARGGFRFSLTDDYHSTMTIEVLATAPSGDPAKGLGTGHWSITPNALYLWQFGEHVGLEAHFGSVFPLSGAASVPTSSPAHFQGKMMTFGVAPSVDIYSKGRTRIAPVVELFGYRIVDGYSTWDSGPAAGTNILNLQAGARIVMGRNSIYGGWSKALTNATWYETAARVEFRHGI